MSSRGSSTVSVALLLGGLGLATLACLFLARGPQRPDSPGSLVVHAAAGLRLPLEQLGEAYTERHGVAIEYQFGGSGALLSALRLRPVADVYLAADGSFIERAQERALVRESLPLGSMTPVLAVAKGNPKGIASLADLVRDDVRVALADPQAAAVGQVTRQLLQEQGLWPQVRDRIKVTKPTEPELAVDLELASVDVAILWSSTVHQRPGLAAVHTQALERKQRHITGGIVDASQHPAEGLRFLRFLRGQDTGAPIFQSFGFQTAGGQPYDPEPRLVVYAGAMLHAVVDERMTAFAEREGIRLDRVYNGCGILLSQMRAGTSVDAYLACDESFLTPVEARFEAPTRLSSNPVVLLVAPGNPKDLRGLADLCQPGLRLGLAHPEKSALGSLSARLFAEAGLEAQLAGSGNLKVTTPTGDQLVNQLRVGALDAALVYRSNAALAGSEVLALPLSSPSALAVQPFAAAKGSAHPEVLARLLADLRSAECTERFQELGFQPAE